jgi:hypothetical protein
MLRQFLNLVGWFYRAAPRQPNTWSSLMTTSDRDDRIAAVAAALRKDADSHGFFSSRFVTDAVVLECATVAVDAIAAYEAGKVI